MRYSTACSGCRYAVERNGGAGTFDCHRYPPEGLTEWVIVRGDDWCGEYSPVPESSDRNAAETIMNAWNKVPGVSGCRQWSAKRGIALRSRMADQSWFGMAMEAIEKISGTPFLTGGGKTGWRANIDWFLRPDTVVKILEDQYQEGNSGENPLQTTEQFFSSNL